MKEVLRFLLDVLKIMGEIFGFMWSRKLWWAFPVVSVLLVIGGLLVLAQATPLGPFIYALF